MYLSKPKTVTDKSLHFSTVNYTCIKKLKQIRKLFSGKGNKLCA